MFIAQEAAHLNYKHTVMHLTCRYSQTVCKIETTSYCPAIQVWLEPNCHIRSGWSERTLYIVTTHSHQHWGIPIYSIEHLYCITSTWRSQVSVHMQQEVHSIFIRNRDQPPAVQVTGVLQRVPWCWQSTWRLREISTTEWQALLTC